MLYCSKKRTRTGISSEYEKFESPIGITTVPTWQDISVAQPNM